MPNGTNRLPERILEASARLLEMALATHHLYAEPLLYLDKVIDRRIHLLT